MALVSVIIPVYNAALHLSATLESALGQTYAEKEIIVVDDQSTDASYAIAQQYEPKGVKVVRQPNSGAAVARNTGLAHAQGRYIQFLDAGDLLDPSKIEEQMAALDGAEDKVAVCNYIQFSEEAGLKTLSPPDQSRFIFSSDDPLDFLVRLLGGKGESNFIQTNCWLVPRNLIDKAGGWRNYRCPDDDGEFFTRVLLASKGIVYVPGVYNYYRISPGGVNQLSQNKNRHYLRNTLLTIDLKYQYLQQKGFHPLTKAAMARQYLDFAVYSYPEQKILSAMAQKRYRLLNTKMTVPMLGNRLVEWVGAVFGWKVARMVSYYLGM